MNELASALIKLIRTPGYYLRISSVNLHGSKSCQRQRCILISTRPKAAVIDQRRKPCLNNQPSYIAIDSVHQSDEGKCKGIYHVNAVDEATQLQIIVTLECINEAFMSLNLVLGDVVIRL